MNKKEREEYISKIQKFVDSGEKVEGKIRFDTMDAVSATYSMAQILLDMNERLNKKERDYNKRTREFDKKRGTSKK